MLLDLLATWGMLAKIWILGVFKYIFPEKPALGLAVFIAAAVFFVYYLVRGKWLPALKMAGLTIVTLSFLLYAIHWLIKLYKVAL